MRYFQVFPLDNRENVWVFGWDNPEGGHTLFDQFHDLLCPNCGKIDEARALERDIDPRVRVVSKKDALRDIIGTDDGQLLVSSKMRDLLDAERITGFEYRSLPGDRRFLLAIPRRVPTDFSKAGLEIHGPYGTVRHSPDSPRHEDSEHRCVACQRYYELCMQPMLISMVLPESPLTVFNSSIRFEKQHGEVTLLFVSEVIRSIIQKNKAKGLEFAEAY